MKVVVIEEHSSNYPNPIAFRQGDKLMLGELDTEFEGWIRAKTIDGNEGWAPIQYIDFKYGESNGLAKYNYNAFELNTSLNEYLTILKELNSWYLASNINGEIGWIPVQTVQIA